MSLFKYFKRNLPLPSPNGQLSREIPASVINVANDEVMEALKMTEDDKGMKQRGAYQKYSDKVKAEIGNYALMHGAIAALWRF